MPGITLSSSNVRINIHNAQPSDTATIHTNDVPTYHDHAFDHIQAPLPSYHATETDTLFTATLMQPMLLDDTSNASGTSKLLPTSLIARLIMLEMLPTRLSRSLQSDCFQPDPLPIYAWSLQTTMVPRTEMTSGAQDLLISGVQTLQLRVLLQRMPTLLLSAPLLPLSWHDLPN
jgi:hypothetical protein